MRHVLASLVISACAAAQCATYGYTTGDAPPRADISVIADARLGQVHVVATTWSPATTATCVLLFGRPLNGPGMCLVEWCDACQWLALGFQLGTFQGSGWCSAAIPVPADPSMVGVRFSTQWWCAPGPTGCFWSTAAVDCAVQR